MCVQVFYFCTGILCVYRCSMCVQVFFVCMRGEVFGNDWCVCACGIGGWGVSGVGKW